MTVAESLSEIIEDVEKNLKDFQFHQDCDYDQQFQDACSVTFRESENIYIKLEKIFDNKTSGKIEKNRKKSIELRELGNKYFLTENYLEALECYSNSVILAPCPKTFQDEQNFEDFSISLTNRAAVLMKINCQKAAAEDLEISLQCGYPKHLRFKAYQRLASAWSSLGDHDQAKENYKLLFKALDDSDLSGDKIKKMKNDCRQAVKKINDGDFVKKPKSSSQDSLLSRRIFSENITVEETSSRGRFSVAKVPIKAGEIVINEAASLINLAPNRYLTHCYTCGRDTRTCFPCHQCCSVRFCSTGCRDSGLEDHLRQCRISETLSSIPDNVDSSITHILTVLNLMLKQSVDQHIETFHQWKTGEEHKDKDESTFLKILNMVKHFDCLDLRQHLASSVLILHLLQYLDYVNHDITTDVRSSLCIIICHYLGVVKSNIHTICELRNSNDNHLVIKPVGVGLYPAVASHVNHSCNPNTFVINIGSTQITVAARDIVAGEEVTQIYVGHYGDTTRERRQELLQKKYHFQCCCQACEEDFPDADKCLQLCKTFAETPQSNLKTKLSFDELESLDARNDELKLMQERFLAKGQVNRAVELVKKRIQLVSEHLKEPHILYIMGRVSLINYMWFLLGNRSKWFKSVKLPTYF